MKNRDWGSVKIALSVPQMSVSICIYARVCSWTESWSLLCFFPAKVQFQSNMWEVCTEIPLTKYFILLPPTHSFEMLPLCVCHHCCYSNNKCLQHLNLFVFLSLAPCLLQEKISIFYICLSILFLITLIGFVKCAYSTMRGSLKVILRGKQDEYDLLPLFVDTRRSPAEATGAVSVLYCDPKPDWKKSRRLGDDRWYWWVVCVCVHARTFLFHPLAFYLVSLEKRGLITSGIL